MEQISPEILQELLASGQAIGGQQDELERQRALAQRLRARATPGQGMTVNNGRTFVASNPLEMLGGLANEYGANQAESRMADSQRTMREAQSQQTNRVLDALIRMGAQPRQSQVQPPQMPQQMPPQGAPQPQFPNQPPQQQMIPQMPQGY